MMRKIIRSKLGKAGLGSGDVAPFLDNGLLDLPGVGPGPGAHLLGDINTLLSGLQLGNQLGHVGTGPLGLQRTLLLGGILDNGLGLVIALLSTLLEATASRGTELTGLLGTSGDGRILLDRRLLNAAHLSGPLGALGEGSVTRSLILALLVLNSLTGHNIVLNIMNLLLGPALRLILSPADLRSLDITILDKGGTANLDSLVECNLLILDKAFLPEVLLALLLLLRLVVGDIGCVTPLVIRMVTLNNIIILSLLNHLDLVNAPLAVSPRGGSSDGTKAHILSLEAISCLSLNSRGSGLSMIMVVTMVMGTLSSVEGEGVDQGSLTSWLSCLSSQHSCCLAANSKTDHKQELNK